MYYWPDVGELGCRSFKGVNRCNQGWTDQHLKNQCDLAFSISDFSVNRIDAKKRITVTFQSCSGHNTRYTR